MLEQRALLRFLASQSAGRDAPDGQTFFDKIQGCSDDELWSFLETGMAKNEEAERWDVAPTVRRYGRAGLYVISGGRR
jgi:hypothetical protein